LLSDIRTVFVMRLSFNREAQFGLGNLANLFN
jgi:hypothetical protein